MAEDVNYLRDIPLGKIQGWSSKKVGKLMIQPIALQDAGATEGIDTLGVYEIMDISGRWTGTFQAIQSYIKSVKSILNGNQDALSSQLQSPFVNIVATNNTYTTKTLHAGIIATNTTVSPNQLIDATGNFATNGIQKDDVVKNLITGEIAEVYGTPTETTINLVARGTTTPKDLFTVTGSSYAVTATVNVKLLNFSIDWQAPGLSICNYKLNVVQVI